MHHFYTNNRVRPTAQQMFQLAERSAALVARNAATQQLVFVQCGDVDITTLVKCDCIYWLLLLQRLFNSNETDDSATGTDNQ